eukprot:gene8359-184_t
MLRTVHKSFTKVLIKQKYHNFHTNSKKFKKEDETENFQTSEIIQNKHSVTQKKKYETKDGEIEETKFKYEHPKKDESFESHQKKVKTVVAGNTLENITEKKRSMRRKNIDQNEYIDELKVKSQTKRATSPERTSQNKFGILKSEEKLEKVQRTQTTVSPYDKNSTIKKKGSVVKHAPEKDYSSKKVELGKVLSQLKENVKTVKSVEKVENQKVIRKQDTVHQKRTVTLETKSPRTLKESEFRRITSRPNQQSLTTNEQPKRFGGNKTARRLPPVEPKIKESPEVSLPDEIDEEDHIEEIPMGEDEDYISPNDFKRNIQIQRAIAKERDEKRLLREEKKKKELKTSKRRESRKKKLDEDFGREKKSSNEEDYEFDYEEGYKQERKTKSSSKSEQDDFPVAYSKSIIPEYFTDSQAVPYENGEKQAKLTNILTNSLKRISTEIVQILNEINKEKEKEIQKLETKVSKGEISQEKANLMKRAYPDVYTLSTVPNFNFQSTDSVSQVLQEFVTKYETIKEEKISTIKDIERLNAFELQEFEKKGELTKEIIESYIDETPMSAIIDEVYRQLDYKLNVLGDNITFDNCQSVIDDLMNQHFVGRNSAVSKYLPKDEEDENINRTHWSQWINEEQKKELSFAFLSKLYEIAGHIKNPTEFQKSIENYSRENESSNDDLDDDEYMQTPDELENHVLVLEKKLLRQIAAFRHEVIEYQIDTPKIEDIRAYKIAGKFGKNRVMVPYERYYSRYIDELKDGSYAKNRFVQQCRSVSKNTTMTVKQKVHYMKSMFNVYKQFNLDTRGERKPFVKTPILEKYLPKPKKDFDERSQYVLDLITQKREKTKNVRDKRKQKKE